MAKLLVFVLELVEPVIDAAHSQQFLVRALLAQTALVEDDDAVGVLDGAKSMRDDHRRAAGKKPVERRANLQLGLGVHAGGGFIENQEARIMRQRAREADQLALADGKSCAALGDLRFHAAGKPGDERAKPHFLQRGIYGSAADVRGAQAHVGLDGAGKQKRVLEDDAKLAAQILQVEVANIAAVDENLAALDVVKAQDQRNDGGLASAGMAYDGRGFARREVEGDAA